MRFSLEVLNGEERNTIHEGSLRVLAQTGMVIQTEQLLNGLAARGARVEAGSSRVTFPEKLVTESIENNRRLLQGGKRLHLLNGVTSEHTGSTDITAKISGGCEYYLDFERQNMAEANAGELLRHIRLGEMLPEVGFVGNTIVMRTDLDGRRIDERMRRIKTAALIAKHTRKLGSMEVWDEAELDVLVEIGTIARGGSREYEENPCFVTAKETISPLFLDGHAGDILLALAKRKLPCTVIPMPITGLSAPVSRLGTVMVGNAEILGVITAIQSVCPEAPVGGGSITGIMDMQTGVVSFSGPEAILQDIAIGEVQEKLYGLDFLIGSGYTDAKYPNSQVLAEKTMKFMLTGLTGRYSYPVGLINGGSVFSAEQALVDLELCRYLHGHFQSFADFAEADILVGLIDKIGVRGNFVEDEHTLNHFRENWLPWIMDNTSVTSIEESGKRDLYQNAHERVRKLLSSQEYWEIDRDRARDIDSAVKRAEALLL
jgi:trimethylamine--corrinoid protein Co-methyltransferase